MGSENSVRKSLVWFSELCAQIIDGYQERQLNDSFEDYGSNNLNSFFTLNPGKVELKKRVTSAIFPYFTIDVWRGGFKRGGRQNTYSNL
jgi:hypothetical protein